MSAFNATPPPAARLQPGLCHHPDSVGAAVREFPAHQRHRLVSVLRRVLRLALPLSVTNLSGFALGLITVAFVGRLGEFELSVAILATSIFNVTGLSVLTGFAAAMETFCGCAAVRSRCQPCWMRCRCAGWRSAPAGSVPSRPARVADLQPPAHLAALLLIPARRQAYGAGSYLLVGVVLQRAVILTTLLVAAVAALWTQAERLLHLLGQDPAIAGGAARYLLLAIPALLFTGMFEASKRYLMAQVGEDL